MKDNKITQHYIESFNTKYFFIGFIVGIVPFTILLSVMAVYKGSIDAIPSLFRNTLLLFGLIISISNAFILSNIANKDIKKEI